MSSSRPFRTSASGCGRTADDRNEAGASEATAMDREDSMGPRWVGPRARRGELAEWQDAAMHPAPVRRAARLGRTAVRRLTRLDPLAWLPPPRLVPGQPPTVGGVGFYGHGNYGDELFLEVFREHLGSDFELRSLVVPGGGSLADRLGAGIRS